MPYTRTFAARLSVVYPMTPLLASPVRNLILPRRSGHARRVPIRFVRGQRRTKPDYSTVLGTPGRIGRVGTGAKRWRCGYRRGGGGWGAPGAGGAAARARGRGEYKGGAGGARGFIRTTGSV